MHLHGWEALKRLIGKRRRAISPDVSRLLSPSNSPSNSTHDGIHRGQTQASPSSAEKDWAPKSELRGAFDKEWVSCPVCGRSIRGIDYNVNSHLDACLTRGTKRKLTQSNLLQFQFSKRNRTEPILDDIYSEEADIAYTEYNNEKEYASAFALPKDLSGIRNGSICESDPSDNSSSNLGTFRKILPPENTFLGDFINQVLDSCDPYISHLNKDELDEHGTKDAISVLTFVSYIVGRRFHASVEWQQGARILLARDSKNVKDRNAIMVLGADSDCRVTLGYLPRELSKYLSPLIDNHYIECEGFVDSLPQRTHDHVPIKLVCRKNLDCTESKKTYADCNFSESLWNNLVVAIKNIKVHQPKMIKYQNNFSLMIEEVISHHSHLFTIEEKTFIGYFTSLSDEGQRLFIRIYSRKGPWFRVSSISYPEIQDAQKAIEELQLAGFIYSVHSCDDSFTYNMKEVLDLLNVSEMRQIISSEVQKKGINCSRRNELINILFSAYASGACPLLPKMILKLTGSCIRISSLADILFWRIQRLFFLNGDQDLSEFLLVDLGIIKFPDYVCNFSHQIFQDRSDLTDYEEAIEVAQIVDESLEENNVEMVTRCIDIADVRLHTSFTRKHHFTTDPPPHFYSCFSASFVYSKVLSLGVSFFEREHRYEDAMRILKGLLTKVTRDSRRGYWTLRLSVNLEHMNRFNESLSVAEAGILDPWVRAGSKMALQRRALRLGKPPRRWRVPDYADSVKRKIKEVCVTGRPLSNETTSKNLYYGYDDELCGVEQLALQYYAEEGGWSGVHSESGIWLTIYGLLMWDVIFCNVPDVFISRFQTAPLDFDTDDFYASREHPIECQLQKIEDGMAEEILVCSWESHMGVACRGVNWERHSLPDLRAAVSCIGGCPLASLCRHLAVDYRSWSSGMPDLLLWRFHGSGSRGEAKLVEVKGPSDRLSEQQRAWLLLLMDGGFDAEVCRVRPLPK